MTFFHLERSMESTFIILIMSLPIDCLIYLTYIFKYILLYFSDRNIIYIKFHEKKKHTHITLIYMYSVDI